MRLLIMFTSLWYFNSYEFEVAISVAKTFDSSRGYLLPGRCATTIAREETRADESSHVSTGERASAFPAILMYRA